MPKYDYSMLRGRIRELFGNEKKFVNELKKSGISMSVGTFSSRINGQTYFKQPEIQLSCKLLRIKMRDVKNYFFTTNYEFNS